MQGGGGTGRFVCVIPHYLQWEIAAGADIHKRLTVMRVHVNQAVICKDKTKDKLFKKTSGLLRKTGGVFPRSNFHAEQLKVTRHSGPTVGLVSVKYASQKVVAF